MSKKIQRSGESIYVAPDMLGEYQGENPVVIDERNSCMLDPRKVADKIEIYEREVIEWFLEPATRLLEQDSFNNAFLVLMVCMSYIEGIEQYKTGKKSHGKSKQYFINSIKRLYPERFSSNDIGKLYIRSRCGLFHNGMVDGGVVFSNEFLDAINFDENNDEIRINPTILLNDINEDFFCYINELRCSVDEGNNVALENFNEIFSIL